MDDVDLDVLANDLGFVLKSEENLGSCGIVSQRKRWALEKT